jgi:alpha-1,2-rhamnosyltransferase
MDLEIGEGDILVLPDAYWAIENFWPAVVKARQRGAFVCTVVYDLIPLDYPHFVVADAVTPFREYVSKLARHSDQIIAISMTVRDQVQQLLTQLEPSCEDLPVVDMFTLGAEQATDTNSKVRQVVSDTMTSEPVNLPYLMVATFEPRKNHEYVLDAFERIWRIEPTRKLCLVGRIGWLCESTLERIKNHPQLGKRLFVFHDLNDAEVQFCYQNSRAVLFPSIVEGFGLPIVEALSAQRHVFASDIPIHREVGGDNCIYCDLNSSEYLTSQILAFEQVRGNRGNLNHHRPLTWEESASEFLQCCLTGWLRRVS